MSTSFNIPPGKKRPLGRTNSSTRIRPYSKHGSNLPSLSTAPAGLTSNKAHVTCTSKSGHDPLDENIVMGVAQTDRAKRKDRSSPRPQAAPKVSRSSTPHATSAREPQSVHAKGKERDSGSEEGIYKGINNRPSLSSSSSTAPSSANTSMTDLESLDNSMDIDAGHQHEHPLSIYNRHHPALDRSRSSDSHLASPFHSDTTFNPVTPAAAAPPRFHPLLGQPQLRQEQHSHLDEAPPQTYVQPQQQPPLAPKRRTAAPTPQNAPLLSQSSRAPPPLGMRRVHTLPSAVQQQHPLPIRQKAFKPPTVSQPPPAAKPHGQSSYPSTHLVRKESMNSVSGENTRPASVAVEPKSSFQATQIVFEGKPDGKRGGRGPSRGASPDHNLEADSSFGDISFDMDALEETMRKYD